MSASELQRGSPYQGLIPYDEADAPFFFGREKEARLIIANLFASPLTVLYGASGVGKSSVLRAGVARQLRAREELLVVVFNAWQSNPLVDLKNKIAEDNNIQVTNDEVVAKTKEMVQQQFGGMSFGEEMDETINRIADTYLKQENGKTYLRIFEQVLAERIVDLIRTKIKIEEKNITVDEFKKLADVNIA